MKKYSFLLILFFASCQIEYTGDERLVVKGNLVDENNQPLANCKIEAWVYKEGGTIPFLFYVPDEKNLISYTTTDKNGNYTMIFPKPSNESSMAVTVVPKENNQEKYFINIQKNNFNDYTLNLSSTKIYKKSSISNLIINLNQMDDSSNEIQYIKLIGTFPEHYVYVNPIDVIDEYFRYDYKKSVIKNQSLIVQYEIFNYETGILSKIEETILVGDSDTITHTFNY